MVKQFSVPHLASAIRVPSFMAAPRRLFGTEYSMCLVYDESMIMFGSRTGCPVIHTHTGAPYLPY
jgi:hypothetical protein